MPLSENVSQSARKIKRLLRFRRISVRRTVGDNLYTNAAHAGRLRPGQRGILSMNEASVL